MEVPAVRPAGPEPSLPVGPDGGAARLASYVDLLLCVGYIDGLFHHREQAFVQQYLDSVIVLVEQAATGIADEKKRIGVTWREHFEELYRRLDGEVAALADEVQQRGDASYLPTKLKVRALTVFRALGPTDQAVALELVQALVRADGMVSAPEQHLYDELLTYFTAPEPAVVVEPVAQSAPLLVSSPLLLPLTSASHPLLDPLEQTYSPHPVELQSQIARDYQLVVQAIEVWNRQRVKGNGLLTGVSDASKIPAGARFLDGHVHVMKPTHPVELIVLGDLHGCYSCLKAALLQSDFIRRVWMHQWDPQRYPDVKLVLLGDYIDRGRFSFDGVVRAALQLLTSMPDHVIMLRGNHEWFVWHEGHIQSGVAPAEALSSIRPYAPPEMLEAYRLLFEHMPTSFLFDRTLFVHAGIPRDDTFNAKWRDLSSFEEWDLRFQMMWSDPAPTDVVPIELQRKNARFSFGRKQFRTFMERIGCDTLIRGHEQIEEGFRVTYNVGGRMLLNLFSAGGSDNNDLPPGAAYRKVTPMALTLLHGHGQLRAIPWPIQYQPFNYEVHNGLHRAIPLLEFRYA